MSTMSTPGIVYILNELSLTPEHPWAPLELFTFKWAKPHPLAPLITLGIAYILNKLSLTPEHPWAHLELFTF
jgi:hypothetical protein